MSNRKTLTRLATLLAGCLLAAGCAGYQVGARSLFPSEVRTVYVPMIETDSLRRNLGEWLTEAVCKEIERRTPYKVVNNASADSVLVVRLVGEQKHKIFNTLNGDPRESQINLRVQVTWVDRPGAALRDPAYVALPPEITQVEATANLVPEVGHSVSTAQQQAIQRLAEQIVNLMEQPW